MIPPDSVRLSASEHCGLARREVLALGALVPVAVALLGGCSLASGTQLTSKVTREKVSLSDVTSEAAKAATACDQLGSKLLTHYLKADSLTTAMASPLSLALTLAILADGATDASSQGYDALLGLSGQERDRAWSAIQNSLNRYDGDLKGFDPDTIPDKPLVHLANHALIADEKDFKVKQSYLDAVLRWFSAEIEQVGVSSMKENLDAWASRNTAGLIPNSGIKVTEDTRLVVQNALLFAAQWDNPFSAESTHQEDFTLAEGKTVKADLMHSTHSIPHATGRGWAAVSKALDKAQTKEVALSLPKLDLTSEPKDLLDFLKDQGLKTVGLDRIAPKLELTQVVQQVRLILDEEGTVAAALSEAAGEAMAAPGPQTKPITFTVDHPYVLRLRDLTSGTALLEAVVIDPTVKTIGGSA